MRKRNLFLLIVTALLAFTFFNIKNVKTVKADVDTQTVHKGIPKQFKGYWVTGWETEADNEYPYLRTAFTMNGQPYGRQLAYFNKKVKYQFGGGFIHMYDPTYKWIYSNSCYFMDNSGYSKAKAKPEEMIIEFINSKTLKEEFINPKSKKPIGAIITAHKYSFNKAHKLMTSDLPSGQYLG